MPRDVTVEIDRADTDDVGAVVDLWIGLAAGQRQYDSHIRGDSNRTPIRESVLRHVTGNQLLVARGEGIYGFVMFTIETGDFEQDVTRGLIENLAVEPSMRNQGIGTKLLRRAEERLADRGADVVALNVMAANEDARRFYRRHGYDPHRLELEKPVGE